MSPYILKELLKPIKPKVPVVTEYVFIPVPHTLAQCEAALRQHCYSSDTEDEVDCDTCPMCDRVYGSARDEHDGFCDLCDSDDEEDEYPMEE